MAPGNSSSVRPASPRAALRDLAASAMAHSRPARWAARVVTSRLAGHRAHCKKGAGADGRAGQQAVTGKRDSDDRQQSLFGTPTELPPAPSTASPKQRPEAKIPRSLARPIAPPPDDVEPDHDPLPGHLARLSAPELRALVEILPDEALANLVLATIRQLKRRLAKTSRNGQKGRISALDRAAQQLMAELGGQGDEDDF